MRNEKLEELVEELYTMKQAENEIIEYRKVLESSIHGFIDVDPGKSETRYSDKYAYNLRHPTTTALDQNEAVRISAILPNSLSHKVFTIKYTINEKELKMLEQTNHDIYNQIKSACTIKPGKKSVTVKLKSKGSSEK